MPTEEVNKCYVSKMCGHTFIQTYSHLIMEFYVTSKYMSVGQTVAAGVYHLIVADL